MRWSRVALIAAVLSLSTAACAHIGDDESAADEQNLGAVEPLVPGEFLIRHPGDTAPELRLTLRATSPGEGQAVVRLSANPNDVRDYVLTFVSRDACGVVIAGKGVDPLYGETETGDTISIYDHRSASGACDIAAALGVEETVRGAKLWWLGRESGSDGGTPHTGDASAP